MSDDGFFGNMPYLATMPSCVLYVRACSAANNNIFDWSPSHLTVTNTNSTCVYNTSSPAKFPPASIYFNNPNASTTSYYLTIPYSSNFNFGTNNFCISAWVYFVSLNSGGTAIVLTYCNTSGYDCGIGLESNGNWIFAVTGSASSYLLTYIGSAPSTGQWYHVAMIRNGTSFTAYINGVSHSMGTSSSAVYTDGSTNPRIGSDQYSIKSSLIGYADEIAIWNGIGGLPVPTISQLYPQTRRLIVG